MTGKRIVIFSYADSVHTGRWASGLAGRGFDMKVISLGGTPVEGVETAVLPRSGRGAYLTQARRAAAEARAFRPDLVHVHSATGYGLWSLATRFKPTIVSVWGTDVLRFPSNTVKRWLVRRILGQAVHITATSNFLKQAVVDLLPTSESKLSVIPFGVKVPDQPAPLEDTGPVRLCFLKVHLPVYGLDVLIKAMADVVRECPDVSLSVAGEGPGTNEARKLVAGLGLEKNVDFVGWLDNRDVYSFIRQHHLMVMPSRMESFGVAVLEAGACGRATLASDVGGIPEVIIDGKTGLMVPPDQPQLLAEKILHLVRNRHELQRMGTAAYEFVRDRFDWEESLDMMATLYDRVIHEAG